MAGLAASVFHLQRAGRLGRRLLGVLSVLTFLWLAAVIATDWPLGYLQQFWNRHAVATDVLVSLLLAGSIYLAFEARQARRDEELGASISATALSGIVDHIVDVDLALAYMAASGSPPTPEWNRPGRPLRWMRDLRCQEHRIERHGLRSADPRVNFEVGPDGQDMEAARVLVDQAIRRLMAGMRDWGGLLLAGREGRAVLERLGLLRAQLLLLEGALGRHAAGRQWRYLRRECLTLALGFELASGAPGLRAEATVDPPEAVTMTAEFAYYVTLARQPSRTQRQLSEVRRRLGVTSLAQEAEER